MAIIIWCDKCDKQIPDEQMHCSGCNRCKDIVDFPERMWPDPGSGWKRTARCMDCQRAAYRSNRRRHER